MNSKKNKGNEDLPLYEIFATAILNFLDFLRNFSVYEMAHWIMFSTRWIKSKTTTDNIQGYKRGTILFVDLGADNFGHEPSYMHPGIVLDENRNNILIAPCSSKKYGRALSDVIDAEISDGFSSSTGVQVGSIRWISKNRVLSRLGKASSSLLDKIDIFMLDKIPFYNREILKYKNEIVLLKKEIEDLKNKN